MTRSPDSATWSSLLGEGTTSPRGTGDLPAVIGRYRVCGELGRGAMGRVLLAHDPELGRDVALKLLLHAPTHEASLRQFVAEARITGQLEHPNIVPVHDVGVSEEGQLFYVMKRIEGTSLQELLDADTPGWGLQRLLATFVDVCHAAAYAHHRGAIHQDLKPSNVLLGPFGEVLVADWGLATLTRQGLSVELPDSLRGALVGSPGFMAPERIASPAESAAPASDQWSLGAILYTLLSRVPPIEGATARARLRATVHEPVLDVRLRDPDREVPDAIAEVCMRALATDPSDRFPDVAALGAEVRAFLEGRQRRHRALEAVAAADVLAPTVATTREQAAGLREQADALLAVVRPSDPVARKERAWDLQDEAIGLLREAELAEVAQGQHLRAALSLVPDLPDAHRRLASLHRSALERAEAARDTVAAAREEALLRQHDRGHHRRWLAGTGCLTLVTEPPGATVTAYPMVRRGRRLQEGEPQVLGTTPLVEAPLAAGSWLLMVEAPDRPAVRYPVFLQRADHWDGVPPGETQPLPIPLPTSLDHDEVYVPAGWFWAGGDTQAPDSVSRRRIWVDGFGIQRDPVTHAAYLAFLNLLVDAGRSEEALRLVPRDKTVPEHPLDGTPIYERKPDGHFAAPPGSAKDWCRTPVARIPLASARTFAATRPRWRLPDELEREKATRGVDGRHFPWGDHHDPAFANMVASGTLPRPTAVGAFEADISVYGIRGLGGNVRDLCGNAWTVDGPAPHRGRLVHVPAPPDVDHISARGGSWTSTRNTSRAATRFGDPPHLCFEARGIRLVRPIP